MPRPSSSVVVAAALSSALTVAVMFAMGYRRRNRNSEIDILSSRSYVPGCHKADGRTEDGGATSSECVALTAHETLIEHGTPLVKLQRVSDMIGRNIFVKMECLNPGGTGKDRAALSMIRQAEDDGLLPPPCVAGEGGRKIIDAANGDKYYDEGCGDHAKGDNERYLKLISKSMRRSRSGGLVVEGTSGSTGIALATLCAARGHACLVVLPDDQATEKQRILSALGAVVEVVPTASISNPKHYVNIARRLAEVATGALGIRAVFCDQFENAANYGVHYRHTGPEVYRQCPQMDSFVMSSGTGGTISGIGVYLKERQRPDGSPPIRVVLVDPPGSALYHKVEHGVAYAPQQRERTLRRHRYDTLAEGIGLDRVTRNFDMGVNSIDCAIRVTDQEAVDMAHWLLRVEGLWIGSSSAMNVVGAIREARALPAGSTVVTMICDGGQRHATRFWNPDFVRSPQWDLIWPDDEVEGNVDDGDRDKIGTKETESVGRIPLCVQGVYDKD